MKKCAYIRGNDLDEKCPFGLSIPEGCKCAGESIERLCPLESVEESDDRMPIKRDAITKMNKKVFFYTQSGQSCKYNRGVIKQKEKVNCDYGDTAEGLEVPPLEGSPFYPRIQSGADFTGLYSAPITFYISLDILYRNSPYGLFSYYGNLNKRDLMKLANACNECGEPSKADKIDIFISKMKLGEEIPFEEAKDFLEFCREEFDNKHISPFEEQELKKTPRHST